VTDVTSRSVTLQWSPPFNTGGVELTGYIIEKRLATTHKWERVRACYFCCCCCCFVAVVVDAVVVVIVDYDD
jgi:hypothetical protein